MKEYGSWVCGLWKREGTELICCKFSGCRPTKDYLQLSSAISLLSTSVRPTARGHTAKIVIWTLDVTFTLQGLLIGRIVCSKDKSTQESFQHTRKTSMSFFVDSTN